MKYFMHLSEGQFPFIFIVQLIQSISSIHYFQSANYLYLMLECFNIILCFHTSCNYYNLDQNLNNNFGVFIYYTLILNFQSCNCCNTPTIHTYSSLQIEIHIIFLPRFNCNNYNFAIISLGILAAICLYHFNQ